MSSKTIHVEGLIGCGKSTTIKRFNVLGTLHSITFEEPLKEFQHFQAISGKVFNPLQEFYIDPKGQALVCQLHILKAYEEKLKIAKSISGKTKIWDRGPDSCFIFTRTLYKLGLITTLGYEFWLKEFTRVKNTYASENPELIFFIDTPIEICIQRQKQRGRSMETQTGIEMTTYLNTLRETYLEYFNDFNLKVHVVSELLTPAQMAEELTKVKI